VWYARLAPALLADDGMRLDRFRSVLRRELFALDRNLAGPPRVCVLAGSGKRWRILVVLRPSLLSVWLGALGTCSVPLVSQGGLSLKSGVPGALDMRRSLLDIFVSCLEEDLVLVCDCDVVFVCCGGSDALPDMYACTQDRVNV